MRLHISTLKRPRGRFVYPEKFMKLVITIDEPLEGFVSSVGPGGEKVVGLVKILSGTLIQGFSLFDIEIEVFVLES